MACFRLNSILSVKIRYSLVREGVYYYYRKVPVAYQATEGQFVRQCLHTSDPLEAAQLISKINKDHERRWQGKDSTQAKGIRLLQKYDLEPNGDHDDVALDNFLGTVVEPKRLAYARGDNDVYGYADPSEYLAPVEVAATGLLNAPPQFLLSDAVEVYLARRGKTNTPEFLEDTHRNWNCLIDVIGDKPFAEVNRSDANKFVDSRLAAGLKTGSVRRQLSSIVAIFNKVITEKELHRSNPFKSLSIHGEGEDAEEGMPFTQADLQKVQGTCQVIDDDIRWLAALQSDLGCRIAEAVGLSLNDLVLDESIPYVNIRVHPWRSLKRGKENERKVPLVGASLWAATRIKEAATEGQTLAFPRYCTERKCKATHASSAVNKFLRSNKLGLSHKQHGSHDFRHTMADRLRNVMCPADLRKRIGGWAFKSEDEKYGHGHELEVMKEWLNKVVL